MVNDRFLQLASDCPISATIVADIPLRNFVLIPLGGPFETTGLDDFHFIGCTGVQPDGQFRTELCVTLEAEAAGTIAGTFVRHVVHLVTKRLKHTPEPTDDSVSWLEALYALEDPRAN